MKELSDNSEDVQLDMVITLALLLVSWNPRRRTSASFKSVSDYLFSSRRIAADGMSSKNSSSCVGCIQY